MEYTQPALLTEKLGLIKRLIYSKKLTIPVWRTRTARYTEPVQYTDYSEWSQMSLGESWVCHYDDARWLEASVTVPEDFAGKHLVLELNMGGEGMVTVNGEPKGSLAFYDNPNCYGPSLPLRHRTRIELGALEAGKQLDISVQLNLGPAALNFLKREHLVFIKRAQRSGGSAVGSIDRALLCDNRDPVNGRERCGARKCENDREHEGGKTFQFHEAVPSFVGNHKSDSLYYNTMLFQNQV